MENRSLGKHIIAEFIGCPRDVLDNLNYLVDCLVEAAKRSGSEVVGVEYHKFKPQGVTAIVLVKESHLAIHTWPEHNYAALDIFTCGSTDPWKAYEYLVKMLKPKFVSVIELKRGLIMNFRGAII